ncbi:hypothetical protein [Calidifontibacter indicus]|uniref:Uncharacterized protein n=1 Tax=Calidifontibacter indicus TaxID=419650 RepID=A0A3D9UM38_9MICO|nr:hypothetical protein [Calidifontibacter indicus]REF30518.1 hypothetical protein DFJ65_1529 [Calidifontibacter indicus]
MSASDDDNRSTDNGDEGSRPEPTREQRAAEMPDELKVDVDQEKLQAWDDAKGDYGVDDDGERPIMVGEGGAGLTDETDSTDKNDSTDSTDSTDEDDSERSEDSSDEGDKPQEQEQHHTSRPDHENRSSAEPTDGQQT